MKTQTSIDFKRNGRTIVAKYFCLVLVIPVIFIAYPLFSSPGIPIGNGDLPYIEISLYSFKKFWTWNEYGSYHGLETLPRYPIIAAFQLVNISPDITSKLLIIGGFAIASFSFYFSFRRLFKNRLDTEGIKFKIAATLGSLFYAYNAWSFQRLGHWYFWLGYAILPLFFVSLIYAFRHPRKWKYILATVLLWSVASSTPHMAIFYGIIFVGISVLYLVRQIKRNHTLRIPNTRPIWLILFAYISINMYWIYPYLVSSTSESFLWSAVVTEEITRDLSQESGFPNVIRLLEGTFNMGIIDVIPPQASGIYPFWMIVSFVPPILAFSALIWKNSYYRYTLFFSAIAIIGILLTMGTNAPLNLYSVLLFYTPLTSYLQILFREPDKWGFLVAFGFSFLIAITTFNILVRLRSTAHKKRVNTKNALSVCFVLFAFSAVIIYFFPAYYDSMHSLYRPVVIPDDFNILQENFKNSGVNRVFLSPYSPSNTTWVKNIGTFELYHVGSPVPNIAAYDYNNVEKYHKYLLDAVVTNKTNKMEDILYPLGTSYLLFHNDTIEPFNKQVSNRLLSSLDGTRLVDSFGFFKLFKIGDNEKEISVVNIPKYNALIVGGLDQLSSLSHIESFNPLNTTLLFLDQRIKDDDDRAILANANYTILSPSAYDYILSFVDQDYLVEPFQATIHHEPSKLWSKAGADDPGNAWFTPYLEFLGMHNSDFDYGKGLVMTEKTGSKLSVPFHIKASDDYEIFVRYLNNQKGGMVKIYLDGSLIDELNTKSTRTNNHFTWKKIDGSNDTHSLPVFLSEGEHTLMLENVAGLNAVNVFAVIPKDKLVKLEQDANSIIDKTRNVYALEAESSFYNNKGRAINGSFNATNGQSDIISGHLKVPVDADLVSFTISEREDYLNNTFDDSNGGSKSGYPIGIVKVIPINHTTDLFSADFEMDDEKKGFVADFENKNENLVLAALRNLNPEDISWREEEQSDLSSIAVDRNSPILGNASLRVDIKKGNTLNWNTISTGFIDIENDSKSVEIGMDVSTEDVNQFHSKIIYYDENKTQIASDFFIGGRNGTFQKNITNVHMLPPDTKYVKLQLLARPNPTKNSSYILDDAKILPLSTTGLENYNDLSSTRLNYETPISNKASFRVDVKKDNTLNWSVISTELIPVDDQSYYDVSLKISAKGVHQLHPKIGFYDENRKQLTSLEKEPLEEIIFPGLNGNFKKNYTATPLLPLGTKYMNIQVLTRPNLGSDSMYQIDDIQVKDVTPESVSQYKTDFNLVGVYQHKELDGMQQLPTNVFYGRNDESSSMAINESSINNYTTIITYQTKPFPVTETGDYSYTISFEPPDLSINGHKKLNQQYPLKFDLMANFANSSDILETTGDYGAKASGGSVLSLAPHSEVYADLDVLKPANYKIALRIGTGNNDTATSGPSFERCGVGGYDVGPETSNDNQSINKSFLTLSFMKIEDGIESLIDKKNVGYDEICPENNTEMYIDNEANPEEQSRFRWLSLNNTYLDKGKYEIRISSNANSKIDLDSVVLYSTVDDNGGSINAAKSEMTKDNYTIIGANKTNNGLVENIFDSNLDSNSDLATESIPAYLAKYEKINPTKYKVDIKDATRPYVMSLAQSYDPLWVAYIDDPSGPNGEVSKHDINNKIKSTPLYSIINGFYIDRKGDYSLIIEYEPQKWFLEAGIVSIIALILSVIALVIQESRLKVSNYRLDTVSFFKIRRILAKYARFWK
jgi:hypothetical protein